MNTFSFYGVQIVESPFIQPIPKIQLSPSFNACSDAMKKQMNDWLLETFGTYLPTYVIGANIVAMHPETVAMIRSKVKGGA